MAPQPMPWSRSACTLLAARASCSVVGSVMPCLLRSALASCMVSSCWRAEGEVVGAVGVGVGVVPTVTTTSAAEAAPMQTTAATASRPLVREVVWGVFIVVVLCG